MNSRTLTELLAVLREPIPRDCISIKNTGQGGFQAEYVNVTRAKDLVDERIGPEHWQTFLRELYQAGEQLILVLQVTISDDEGKAITHIGTGWEAIEGVTYGDTSSNAYAMAFRRALESFGFGRELWRKHEDHSVKASGQSQQPKPFPTNPLAKSVSELATPKQIVMIRAVCRDLHIDVDMELQETMKLDCKVEELSRRAASSFIDHLKQLQEGNEIPIVRRDSATPLPDSDKAELVREIELGYQELRLNVGERKAYAMKALGLKKAPELHDCTIPQLKVIMGNLRADLAG